MKTLILALALIAGAAQAQTFVAGNNGGGQIVLKMDEPCKRHKELMRIYTFTIEGLTLEGCWAYIDNAVHVLWDDGDKRVYPADMFQRIDKPAPKRKGSDV